MDEVDGVGSGDRGGITALCAIIKDTKTPIICICNDRQSRKLGSLVNMCLDLKFMKPTEQMVVKRIQMICKRENLEIDTPVLKQLIESSGNDLR